jgi:ribonuclease P protein component
VNSPKKPQTPKKRGSLQVQTILKAGKRIEKDFLALYWMSAGTEPEKGKEKKVFPPKVFLIVGKRALRLAHERNRAKRLIREICRKWRPAEEKKFQLAIRVVKEPPKLTMACFKDCLESLLERALT